MWGATQRALSGMQCCFESRPLILSLGAYSRGIPNLLCRHPTWVPSNAHLLIGVWFHKRMEHTSNPRLCTGTCPAHACVITMAQSLAEMIIYLGWDTAEVGD